MELIDLNLVALSESSSQPGHYVLVLEEPLGKRRIPLIIGSAEAQAIVVVMENLQPLRPFTHDLFYQTLCQLGATLNEARITHLEKDVFYASLFLTTSTGTSLVLDARPSDAIALMVRFGCPLRTTSAVLESAGYFADEKDRDERSSFSEYSLSELETMQAQFLRDEAYEQAARVRQAIEQRRSKR